MTTVLAASDSVVELSRFQFALTSLYHFIFVPLTLGLAPLVAVMQTAWYRTRDERWLRLTHFFGTLFIINFAIGAATGLVQEFEFGMNWSTYSKTVGDVFGAPLAMEGLAAFFLESTFIGLWIFGRDRLSPRVHLATIWLVVLGTWLSSTFILIANSWMQHPVGYKINPATGRPVMDSVSAVFTNEWAWWAVAHTLLAALMTGAFLVLGVAAWHLLRRHEAATFRLAAKLALIVAVPVTALNLGIGSEFGVVITDQQPMKIASAEALWNTEKSAGFSLFQIGGFTQDDPDPSFSIEIPGLLSFLATNSFNGTVEGLNQVNADEQKQYGAGNYIPDIRLTYWSIRIMAYAGSLSLLVALLGWLLWRRGRFDTTKWFLRLAIGAIALPFVSCASGWIFTEAGRQPWAVQGLLKTADAVSPSLTTGQAIFSLAVFISLYLALGVADFWLMRRYSRRDLPDAAAPAKADPEPALRY
jgi:cytochrome bd ubiquinol oxidase subunit I